VTSDLDITTDVTTMLATVVTVVTAVVVDHVCPRAHGFAQRRNRL
jgi:hypothetical protein